MRFLSWNCQGLGSDLTRRNLKILCKKQNPQILFFMETRQPENVILSWRRNLKFVDHVVVNPVNTGGGLALFWNNEVRVTVEDSSPNFVDTTVCFLSDGFVCKISWFYGSPHINEKMPFGVLCMIVFLFSLLLGFAWEILMIFYGQWRNGVVQSLISGE